MSNKYQIMLKILPSKTRLQQAG